MNSINSKAWIHSAYQTQDSNTTSWWLRILIKHSRWRLNSPFRDSNQSSHYLLFQFQKWLCFQQILTTTFRLPIPRIHFPWQRSQARLLSWNLFWLDPWQQWCIFCQNQKILQAIWLWISTQCSNQSKHWHFWCKQNHLQQSCQHNQHLEQDLRWSHCKECKCSVGNSQLDNFLH